MELNITMVLFKVSGERNSGTNFLYQILNNNNLFLYFKINNLDFVKINL